MNTDNQIYQAEMTNNLLNQGSKMTDNWLNQAKHLHRPGYFLLG